MAELKVDLFCEDRGHEVFCTALLKRLGTEADVPVRISPRCVRGGHGRATTELRAWLRSPMASQGDLLVVVIDANSVGWHKQRQEVERCTAGAMYPTCIVGCPDPEVEAWLCADRKALTRVLGIPVDQLSGTVADWKAQLRALVKDANIPLLGDEMDLSLDVVPEMSIFDACKASPSLADFVKSIGLVLKAQ